MTKEISLTAYHGIPGGKDDLIVTLKHLHKFLGCQSLGNHHLVHESAERTGADGGYNRGEVNRHYWSNHRSVITKKPFAPLFSPHEFSTL